MSIARFSDIVHYLHCPVVGQWILDPDLVRCSRSGSREPQHVSAAGHPSPLFIGDGHKTTFARAPLVRGDRLVKSILFSREGRPKKPAYLRVILDDEDFGSATRQSPPVAVDRLWGARRGSALHRPDGSPLRFFRRAP